LTAAASLAAPVFWAIAVDRMALVSALLFLLPAFPFFLAISVSLPMVIPLRWRPAKSWVFPRHAWPYLSVQDFRFPFRGNWSQTRPVRAFFFEGLGAAGGGNT
jgi:hypothetical protein